MLKHVRYGIASNSSVEASREALNWLDGIQKWNAMEATAQQIVEKGKRGL